MCITEIWTYHECGCHYLDPIPCYDRILQSPQISCKPFEKEASASRLSLSSTPSVLENDVVTKANEPVAIPPSQQDSSGPDDDTAAAYDHRLHLVRICSIRQIIQKTFLEPICDDCVLLELGLISESTVHQRRCDNHDHDERELDGTEWLLESSVEITVEPPADHGKVFPLRSKPGNVSSSSEDGTQDETPRRGRGSRRAMEMSRGSLTIDTGSPLKRRTSMQRLKQTGQRLRRARKQHDLPSLSAAASRPLQSSATGPSSWVEHLRSDLGQRVRRRRPDLRPNSQAAHQNESSNDASSSASEDDHILSLPSIPATASSAFSTTSTNGRESIIPPLDQLISSSEFDSSQLGSTHPPEPRLGLLHPNQGEPARTYTSSSRSVKPDHTASSTVSPSSPVAELGSTGSGIALHPLSSPLPARASSVHGTNENKTSEDEENGDNEKGKNNNDKGNVGRGKSRSDMLLIRELVEAGMGMSWAAPQSAG
ncbi:hypothetical protein EPUS_06408 [Endocarpon pusillum Z07020]|uniref:Uncharacterized protein n=1 Tax=Endocarpon pusillum (strain Z07020 / HMAS-L-300199) TaxID=1263415 RepID=U1G7P9_ENDPU|nr:uncharacterized protein EPUS_06408 [Endocarpon pusillum Z07020]ERF68018.1 hypothetical protein EPUS_06408 [Endocarpon pusillum Z07020]